MAQMNMLEEESRCIAQIAQEEAGKKKEQMENTEGDVFKILVL